VLSGAVVKQANQTVPDAASVDLKKKKIQTEDVETEGKVDANKEKNKPELRASNSTDANDALAKEMFAKNQISEAAPKKNNILKYGMYAGIIALGLAIVALFFSDYTRDNRLLEEDKQAGEMQKKNDPVPDEQGLDESKLNSQSGSAINVNAAEVVTSEAEKTAELEKEKLEKAKLAKEKQAKLAMEKDEKARLAQKEKEEEQAEKDQAAKEQAKKEQAAKEKKRRAQKKTEANDKRRIAEQIRQREAELEAKAESRRLQLEVAKLEKLKREREEVERKILQEQEAKRLEQEWLEKQRKNLRAVEASKKQSVLDEGFIDQPKKKLTANCAGPAAKFKAICR
jgi:hypothetical protein